MTAASPLNNENKGNAPSPLMGEGVGGGEWKSLPPTLILPRKGGGYFFGVFSEQS